MPRRKRPYIEFRDYNLSSRFPVLLLSGEEWRISDVASPRLHIHNCLEIGLCESDSGTMIFEDTKRPFGAGDLTVISCDVPHTTDRKSTRLNSSHIQKSRMPSSA